MALADVHFQEGEGQDFLLELPSVSYTGELLDIASETSSGQFLVLETPLITNGGGNIFIMSE